METPLVANQCWSLDFVSDQMTDGRRFRILTVIDNCTREWPPLGSIVEALQGLHSAIADGVGVRGYFYWSLLDDFERIMGYGPRFGLIRIDRQPMRRAISPPRSS